MWTCRKNLTLPTSRAAAVILWVIATVLMFVETIADAGGRFARWSILLAIAAATLTITAVIGHARRVVLDVVSWEAQRIREHDNDGGEGVVSVLRRP